MKLNKCLLPVIIILTLFQFGVAQQYTIPCISEKYLEQHVNYLASDSLQGRSFFTENPGLELAADYIRNNIKKMGLGFPGECYYQTFKLHANRLDRNNTFIKVFNKKKKEKDHLTELAVLNQESEMIDFSGEITFIGFGWKDEETGYNDYTGVDLKDKIVIFSAGTPESFNEGFSQQWNNPQERKKTEEIFEAGAKAIILVTSPQDTDKKTFSQIRNWAERPRFFLVKNNKKDQSNLVITTPSVASAILGRKGIWEKLLNRISIEKKTNPFIIQNRSVQIQSVRTIETHETRNIIGIVEGADPQLKDECLVFMAHYDHLGMDENGEIFNGADDNASGTAALIEVARAFSEMAEKPRRSIVFLWVTAEEVGLMGSEYYSQNPVFPLNKTVACINLDMVGRVYEPRDSVWSHSPKLVKNFTELYVLANDYNPELKNITNSAFEKLGLSPDYSLPNSFFYTSDHYHFHRNEVPILNFSTGYTADYHRTTDTSDRIRYDKIKKVAELCVLTGMAIANE